MTARGGQSVVVPGGQDRGMTGEISRRRIMSAHISREHRLLGFDPLEWLMVVVAILLLGLVALAI
jgi:hypothetical protein